MGDQGFGLGGLVGHPAGAGRKDCYRYDLSEDTWDTMTSSTYDYKYDMGAASAYEDGYTWGGGTGATAQQRVEKYDISGNSWSNKNDMPYGGGIGCRPHPIVGYMFARDKKYDYVNDIWKGILSAGFDCAGCAVGFGGYIYVLPGDYSTTPCKKYDPADDSWSAITDVTGGHRETPGTWQDGTYGYFLGGNAPNCNVHHRYDPDASSWTTRASRPVQISGVSYGGGPGSFVIEGMGHAFCCGTPVNYGEGNYNGRYDNDANSWSSKQVYPQSLTRVLGFAVPDNFPPAAPSSLSVSTS